MLWMRWNFKKRLHEALSNAIFCGNPSINWLHTMSLKNFAYTSPIWDKSSARHEKKSISWMLCRHISKDAHRGEWNYMICCHFHEYPNFPQEICCDCQTKLYKQILAESGIIKKFWEWQTEDFFFIVTQFDTGNKHEWVFLPLSFMSINVQLYNLYLLMYAQIFQLGPHYEHIIPKLEQQSQKLPMA